MPELNLQELKDVLLKHKEEVEGAAKQIAQQSGDRATEAMKALETQVEEAKKNISALEEQVRNATAQRIPGLKEELKKNQFSFQAVLRAQLAMHDSQAPHEERMNPWKHAGYEKEVIDEAVKRAADGQVAADGSQGGFLIPEEVTNEIIDMTIADMPIMSLGPTMLRGLVGDLPIPTVTARPTGYMVSETEAPTKSKAAFGEVMFRPKKAGAFVKQSKRLIYQSRGVAEPLIRKLISESLALKMEEMFINGSGTDKQPEGVLNGSNYTTGETVSGRFRFDHLRKLLKRLDVADELKPTSKIGVLMRPEVLWGLKGQEVLQYSGQTAGSGMPIWAQNLLVTDAAIQDQYNVKLAKSTLVPFSSGTYATTLVGNFSQFYIGMWRGFRLLASDVAGDGSTGSAFLQDQLYIVAFQEFDSHVTRGSAFTTGANCETNESNWS